ncbi:unnamed protein product [Lepidochelys kempii]
MPLPQRWLHFSARKSRIPSHSPPPGTFIGVCGPHLGSCPGVEGTQPFCGSPLHRSMGKGWRNTQRESWGSLGAPAARLGGLELRWGIGFRNHTARLHGQGLGPLLRLAQPREALRPPVSSSSCQLVLQTLKLSSQNK